jgi:hypothetical protein
VVGVLLCSSSQVSLLEDFISHEGWEAMMWQKGTLWVDDGGAARLGSEAMMTDTNEARGR